MLAKKYEQWLAAIVIVTTVVAWNAQFLLVVLFPDYEHVFAGTIGLAKGDKSVYYSMIEQVRQGGFFVHNIFTAETSSSGLFHPLWIVLGWLARLLRVTSFEIFSIAKIVSGLVFLIYLYRLSYQWWQQTWQRLLFVVGLGWFGGFGVVGLLVQIPIYEGSFFHKLLPVDLWYSEGFSYLTLFHSPLFIVSQVCIIWMLWLVVVRPYTIRRSLLVAGILGLLFFMHPFDILAWWAIVGAWLLLELVRTQQWNWEHLKKVIPSIASTGLVGVYYVWLMTTNVTINAWHSQNILPPPSFYAVITGYGLLLPLSVAGCLYVIKHKPTAVGTFLVMWYVTLPLLIYTPFGIARRFINSWGVVVIVMSVFGIQWWWEARGRAWWQSRQRSWLSGLVATAVLLLIVTPVFQVTESIYRIVDQPFPEFRSTEEIEVVAYFAKVDPSAVIIAPPYTANIIPAHTARRVYLGHDVQTIQYKQKIQNIKRLYTAGWSEWKQDFVLGTGAKYLVWPKDLGAIDELSVVFSNEQFVIYSL